MPESFLRRNLFVWGIMDIVMGCGFGIWVTLFLGV